MAVRRANDDPSAYVMVGHTQTLAGVEPGIFVMRTDPLGNPIWAKTYGRAPGRSFREKLEIRNCDTGYIICGSMNGGSGDVGVLLRIDDSGNQLWMRTYQQVGTVFDYTNFKDVTQIASGFAVTGHALSQSPPGPFQNSIEAIILTTDSAGTPVWGMQYPNLDGNDSGESLAILSQGYAVVGGHTAMPVGGVPATILFTTDGAGTLSWYRRIYGVMDGGSHYGGAIANGTLRPLAGGDLVFVGGAFDQNAALLRFDAAGVLQASRTFGFTSSQYGTSVLVEPAGAGYTFVGPVSSGAQRDYYVVRTDAAFVSGCHEKTIAPPIDVPPIAPVPIAFTTVGLNDVVVRVPIEPPLAWTETVLCAGSDCVDPVPITCTVGFLSVTIAWPPLPATVATAELWRDGALLATVTGTSYVDSPTPGSHGYELKLFDASPSCEPAISTCSVVVGQLLPGIGIATDVIFVGWKPLPDEPIICVGKALTDKGRRPWIVSSLAGVTPALGTAIPDIVPVVWVSLGDFPEEHVLTAEEAQSLADLLAAGCALYIEGGDVAFGAQSALTALDGVDAIADGDILGAVPGLTGLDSGVGLDATALSASYTGTGRSIDHLVPSGTGAGAIFQNAGAPGQTTAVYHDAAIAGAGTHRVITSSTGFHGYGGDRDALIGAFVDALSPRVLLIRGDTNDDGNVDIGDAIRLLGNLFPGPGGAAPLACVDAGDTNDDGAIDIADAISLLASLFGSPTVPLPPPNAAGGCGPDPTILDANDCASFSGCP